MAQISTLDNVLSMFHVPMARVKRQMGSKNGRGSLFSENDTPFSFALCPKINLTLVQSIFRIGIGMQFVVICLECLAHFTSLTNKQA